MYCIDNSWEETLKVGGEKKEGQRGWVGGEDRQNNYIALLKKKDITGSN